MMLSSLLSRKNRNSSVPQQVSVRCRNFNLEFHGLKILTTVDHDPKPCVQRCDLLPTIDLIYEDAYDFDIERACIGTYGRHQIKLFPPPISMLARTEQMRSYMPWTLIKSSDGQGRVVMKEVRVKHHDYYFKASREDGRRTLQLMSVDENSLVFAQQPKHEKDHEKEMTVVEQYSRTKLKISSSSESPSTSFLSDFNSTLSMPSSEFFESSSGTDDEINNTDIKGKSIYIPRMLDNKKIIEDELDEDEEQDNDTSGFPELYKGYYTYKESSLPSDTPIAIP